MNAKKVCAILTVVSLVMPAVALALEAPTITSVAVDDVTMRVDWTVVTDAVKYSLDLEGTVTYWDAILMAEATADVELSFGTSDRTDGGVMADPYLILNIDDIAAAIAAQLGVPVEDLIQIDGLVKVKALAPGKGAGAQDNPFSAPSYGTLVF